MHKKLFLLLALSFTAEARWANLDDASIEMKFYNSEIKVNKNGTSEEIVEFQKKILKESGRSEVASFRIFYNSSIEKVKIIDAYTIYDGVKYQVELDKIEDKPIASTGQGFNQQKQIMISFPKAEVGAEIYLKVSNPITKTALNDFYNNKSVFGSNSCWNSSHYKITSQLPLYLEINDPSGALQVIQDKKEALHTLDIKLTKPICAEIASASETGEINLSKYTWFTVSSLKNWQDFAKQTAVKYEKVINQPIPELFLPILEAAKVEKDEIVQLNLVTSLINDKIRYMGNWITIDDAFYPRDLAVIAKAQEGDCKEYTVLTAAILKILGYKVQPALVWRGKGEMSISQVLPSLWATNHVFLKVTNKAGKIYWIDSTNTLSMAQGIFPDIADKMILILDSKEPSYERSADINAQHSEIIFNEEMRVNGDEVFHSGDFNLIGESALALAGARLFNSEEVVRNQIFHLLSGKYLNEEDKKELILPDLSTRIVKDLVFIFKYKQNNALIKTNIGFAMEIGALWIDQIINNVPDQLSDIYIGPNHIIKKNTVIKDVKIKNIKNLNYDIDTTWLTIKRVGKYNGNDSEISDIVIIKKSFITSEELQSQEYKSLKDGLEKNLKNVAVILNK